VRGSWQWQWLENGVEQGHKNSIDREDNSGTWASGR
jgi:hypothetical protein